MGGMEIIVPLYQFPGGESCFRDRHGCFVWQPSFIANAFRPVGHFLFESTIYLSSWVFMSLERSHLCGDGVWLEKGASERLVMDEQQQTDQRLAQPVPPESLHSGDVCSTYCSARRCHDGGWIHLYQKWLHPAQEGLPKALSLRLLVSEAAECDGLRTLSTPSRGSVGAFFCGRCC